MKKSFRMFLALVLMALGAVSANAGERIPVNAENFTFHTHDGWDVDAVETGVFDGAFIFGAANGCPIGDTGCNAWIDLGAYSKLYVKMEGCDANGEPNGSNPRIFINRMVSEGQFNSNKSDAKCIVLPNDGTWAEEYYNKEDDGTYVIDLNKIAKEWGFVHFHSIKGSAYNTQAIVYSLEVEKADKGQQIGWINLINNSDMEGDDASSFFTKIAKGDPANSVITDGVGVNGSRGIVVEATAKESDPWDNQFWFRFNEPVAAGSKYRVSFDYKADTPASASTQAHAEPSDYIHYEMFGNIDFTADWQTFTKEGEVTAQQSTDAKQFLSVAFNLNEFADANNYYFDNIKFEVYKAGITAEYYMDAIQVDFGFETNIAELVKASGKPRLLFPIDCVSVKVDGQPIELISAEGYADGRFYIFTEDAIEGDEVLVTVKNPTDAAYHLIYTTGPGGDVPFFSGPATENEEIAVEDAYAYRFVKPTLLSADPEDGSFNLPNNLKEFNLVFDKPVDLAKVVATLGKEKLAVEPAEGAAEAFKLVRTSTNELATGLHTLHVTNVLCEEPIDETDFTEFYFTLSVGKVETDPNDVPKDMIPDYLAQTSNGAIPEGYLVRFGEEDRMYPNTYGSGPRLFDFAAGGDFTKGLYFREGYVEYGSIEGYELTLEAGKKYNIHFNSAMWKDNGANMTFEVLNEADEAVISETINNTPNVNGSTAAVNNSTSTTIQFIPDADGKYRLKWSVGGFNEVLLANVSVKYIPSIFGVEETALLNEALANAIKTSEENADERYDGATYQKLNELINKYNAEKDGYTNPSAYKSAAAALDAAAQAVKDHHANCDSYDSQIKMVIDVVRKNAETKFNVTELYAQAKALNDKYHGASEWVAIDPENPETEYELVYSFDKLTDDAALAEAVKELDAVAKAASNMFTEGESKTSSDVGIKVLVDRIRQGVEGLKQLGVADDDPLVVKGNNAVSDDDELAEEIKHRLTIEYYAKMKDGANLFPETTDEETGETTTPTYNFTVFVKNPNTYAWKESEGVTEENCPGWTVVEGGKPGTTSMWNGSYPGDIDGLPKDLTITAYHSANRIEQTITDLPAGIYTVMIDATEWSDEFTPKEGDTDEQIAQKEINHEQNRAYVKTSATPVFVEGQEEPEQFAGDARLDNRGQYAGRYENFFTDIVVTDGVLTLGVKWNNIAQMMFDRVKVLLAAPATDFNYKDAYETGIEGTEAAPVKVRAIQLYDLNGRRVLKAQKGITIVKKQMSDGTIRTEKVVVK